ncbi:phosphatidylinositol-binding protein scs2 [Ceratobasidium sp. 414]|nr:phosphatidylinositol-binding protein scs2 [Ceratobasidium sp. 414]
MSVRLNPSDQLGFHRPFTQNIRRTLTITNHNAQSVAFKVMTTAPRLYAVRPFSGIIEPGDSVDAQVSFLATPLSHKCEDKFLVQSMTISPDRLSKSARDMWVFDEDEEVPQIHQQKIKVVYLPPKGQVLEEDTSGRAQESTMAGGVASFNLVQNVSDNTIHTLPHVPSPRPSLVPSIIGRATPLSDVISLLVEHGCQDITEKLDPSAHGEYPVSSGGFGDVYKGRLRDGSPIAIKCMRVIIDPYSEVHMVMVDRYTAKYISVLRGRFTPGQNSVIIIYRGSSDLRFFAGK